MTVWRVPLVQQQAEIELVQWGIAQVENGDWHFVGYNITDYEGRVSSRIVRFDLDSMIGVTASGRVYRLYGPPGDPPSPDALYVFERWRAINGVERFEDITGRLLSGDIKSPDDRH